MKNHDLLYVKDIIASLIKIEKYISDLSDEEFIKNEEKQEVVLFNLQVIGEASSRISGGLKKIYSDIEWRKLTRLRNFIVHEYFKVDPKDILFTIKNDLPNIKKQILEIERNLISKR